MLNTWGKKLIILIFIIICCNFLYADQHVYAVNVETLIKDHARYLWIIIAILVSLFIIFILLQGYIKYLRRKILVVNQEVLNQHEWLKVTLGSIGDAVIATDEKGKVTFINHMAQRYTGLSEEEALGKPVQKVMFVISEESREPLELPISKVLEHGQNISYNYNFILIAKSGKEFSISNSLAPIRNDHSDLYGVVIVFQDITQRKIAENALKWERDFSNNIVNNAEIIILIWEVDEAIIKFNTFGEINLGFKEEEFIGKRWMEISEPEGFGENMKGFFNHLEDNHIQPNFEWEHMKKNGKKARVLWNNSLIRNEEGEIITVVSMGIDITQRKEAESKLAMSYDELEATHEELAAIQEELKSQYDELRRSQSALKVSEERYRLAVDGSNDALWDLDMKIDKLFISMQGKEMLGYKENEITTGENWINLIHPSDLELYTQNMNYYFTGKTKYCRIEYRVRQKNGEYKWVLSRAKAIWDESGDPIRMAGSHTDISDRKRTEEEIHHLAYYDTLTGLPNRTMLMDRLNLALAQSRRSRQMTALLYLDLDNFKAINDTQGHIFGDELIRSVADKMKEYVREYDTVSRLGGDEFVILQPQIKNMEDVTMFADRILSIFENPWKLKGREFYVTASVGISLFPNDGKDGQSLLKNADAAMYKAKAEGKNNYKLYIKSMNDDVLEKLEIERNLRHAIENKEFIVHYQPQVDIQTGKIVGIEALVRWLHPTSGMIPPLKFIPLAEETGLILQIGEWVLRTSCIQAKRWQDAGIPPIYIAVNLSARQFQQQNLVEVVKTILDETGLDSKWLELEITESIAMQDMDNAILKMRELKEMGILITMDDFGTGYSSLNYLKRLPINNLKIDKTFVQGITTDKNEEAIAKAIITLSHSMNLNLTAEGVETEEQLHFLQEQKCDKVQGYLFSRPLPVEELEKVLRLDKKFC